MKTLTKFGRDYSIIAVGYFYLLYKVLPKAIKYSIALISGALVGFIIFYNGIRVLKKCFKKQRLSSCNKAVFITGCDSGFGQELAKRLDQKDYVVFAGCLFPDKEGANVLREASSSRLHIVGIDVTKQDSIEKALSYVERNLGDAVLWAVVNNAGILQGIGVGWGKMEPFENCLNVNSLGPVRVTRAFLPLLRKSQGRVVTIASLAGHLPMDGWSPYTMSKFAAVAFSQCLREEMKRFGIQTISIEPELFQTSLVDVNKLDEEASSEISEELMEMYDQNYFTVLKSNIVKLENLMSPRISRVVDSLEDAISLRQAEDSYQPCRSNPIQLGAILVQAIPRSLLLKVLSRIDILISVFQ